MNHDLHARTVWSDNAHPIPVHILEGRALELDAIAIADYYTPGSELAESDAESERCLAEIERKRSGQHDLIVLKGVESIQASSFLVGRLTSEVLP